jgi:hypothetical protein
MKSIFQLTKELEKKFSIIAKRFNFSEKQLAVFFLRSEDTSEWVFGSRYFGEKASEDKEYLEILKKYLKNENHNRHILRHSFLSFIIYLSKIIEKNSDEELFSLNIFRDKKEVKIKPSKLFYDILYSFEQYGVLYLIDSDLTLNNRAKEILKKLVEEKEKKVKESIKQKKELLNRSDLNEKSREGIERAIENLEKELDYLKKQISYDRKYDPQKLKEILKINDFTKRLEEYFKSFEEWLLESAVFGVNELFKAIKLNPNSKIAERFLSLDYDTVLFGILSYGVSRRKIGYIKNSIAISSESDEGISLFKRFLSSNYKEILKLFINEKPHHFIDLMIEISNFLEKKSDSKISVAKILEEIGILKNSSEEPYSLFTKSGIEIDKFISSTGVVMPDISNMRNSLISFVYSIYNLKQKRNTREKIRLALVSLVEKSLNTSKSLLPELLQAIKLVFYEDLRGSFYLNQSKISDNAKKTIKNHLIVQFYLSAIVERDWNTPKIYEKEVGTIIARILQAAYLFDREFENENFFEEIYYSLFYILPDKNVFDEVYEYIFIEEVEKFIGEISSILKTGKYEFNNYFIILKRILKNKEQPINFIIDYKREKFKKETVNFIEKLLFYRIKYEKITEEGIDFILEKEGRGGRLLDDFAGKIIYKKIGEFETLLRKKINFIEKMEELEALEIKDIENLLDNYIFDLHNLKAWFLENMPFIESTYLKITLEKEIEKLKKLYDALSQSREEEILTYYTEEDYKEYHPFIEKWLSKRLLFTRILDKGINAKIKEKEDENISSPNTALSNSKKLRIFSFLYKWTLNPFAIFSIVIIPLLLYVLKLNTCANTLFSIFLTSINILLPVGLSFFLLSVLYNITKKKEKSRKSINDIKFPIGIMYYDFFFPKLFGLIVIAIITIIGADENWAMGFFIHSYSLWQILFFFIITFLFVRHSIVSSFSDINEKKSITYPSLNRRIWNVISIGIFESFVVVLFYESIYAKLMYERAELSKVINMSCEKIFNIPKWTNIEIWRLSLQSFPLKKVMIGFSPIFVLTAIVSVLFVGVVLNLFLNKDKIV